MVDAAAYVGLGSNLGDRLKRIREAVAALDAAIGVDVDFASGIASLYETSPVGGGAGQPDFLNSVCRVDTRLTPDELLDVLLGVERSLGRVRGPVDGPRSIDLDLLLFGDVVIDSAALTIPHPRLHARGFVLFPLAEIAGEVRHPVLGESIDALHKKWVRAGSKDVVRRVDHARWAWPVGAGRRKGPSCVR